MVLAKEKEKRQTTIRFKPVLVETIISSNTFHLLVDGLDNSKIATSGSSLVMFSTSTLETA